MNRLALIERGERLPVVRGRCRVCLEPLPKRRRGFCSDEHRNAFYMATSSDFARRKVFERDKGVCANCGLDADALEVRVFGFSTMVKKLRRKQEAQALMLPREERIAKVNALMENGWPKLSPHPSSLWACDHIEPVADFGSFDLSNCQTLDLRCHSEKTSMEATARAKRRKLVGRKQIATMRRFRKLGIT